MKTLRFYKYKKLFNISRTLDDGLPFFLMTWKDSDCPFWLFIFSLMIFVLIVSMKFPCGVCVHELRGVFTPAWPSVGCCKGQGPHGGSAPPTGRGSVKGKPLSPKRDIGLSPTELWWHNHFPPPGAALRSQNWDLRDVKHSLATAAHVYPDTWGDVQVALEHSGVPKEEYVSICRCSLTFESAW